MKLLRSAWKHRTFIERFLFVFSICAIFVIVALGITVGVWRNRRNDEANEVDICYHEECVSIAADLLTSMNETLDPCDDFYEFSCQKWISRSSLVDDGKDRLTILTTTLNEKLKEMLDNDEIFNAPLHFQQAKEFYKNCMDWVEREKQGVYEFISDLNQMGGWPMVLGDIWDGSTFDYLETLRRMLRIGFDTGELFSVGLAKDYKNTSVLKIMIHQTTLGLPHRGWYENDNAVELYKNTIQTYGILISQLMNSTAYGVTVESIHQDASDAVELERTISQMMYSKEYVSENRNTYNLMTIKQLDLKAPLNGNNSWLRFFKIFFPYDKLTENEVLIVTVPKFIQKMAEIIRNLTSTVEGNRILANYMFYRQVMEAAPFLNLVFKKIAYVFNNYGTDKLNYPVPWKECLAQTSAVFDFSLASMYIRKYFPAAKKQGIVDLVDRIKEELSVIINETTWMDKVTQERANQKLKEISVMAVYPDNILNDTYCNEFFKLVNVTNSYYDNVKSVNIFLYNLHMTGLREPIMKEKWKHFPSSILESNAFYTPTDNRIFITLGIAHRWVFNEQGPAYTNYGRIGGILGHEMSHAFDNEGAQYDGHGNWRDWWDQETKGKFNQAKTCLVQLFNDMTYSVPNKNISIKLNGTKTLGENIADDMGIQEAYQAYKKVNSLEPQQALPGVNLTPNQLFWVSYASAWCEKNTDIYYVYLIENDEHSPAKDRVNSPLRNNVYFINDFNCKLGSNMNPTNDKCHLWGV